MNIPKGFKGKVYFHYDTSMDFISITKHEHRSDTDYILLGSLDVEIEFNADNVIPAAVEALNKRIEQEKEASFNRIQLLRGQISSLTALEHIE